MLRPRWRFMGFAIAVVAAGCGQARVPDRASGQVSVTNPDGPPSPEGAPVRKVRPAAVAGLFYPDQKEALAQQIEGLLDQAKPLGIPKLRGLVVPHAGYRYSGPTAAVAYKQIAGAGFRTVVVMAPSHYASFRGAYMGEVDAYETPLGRVPVAAVAQELAKEPGFVRRPICLVNRPDWSDQSPRPPLSRAEDRPDTWEHSLEVQLPFLQKVLGEFALVPIVFGSVDPREVAQALSKHLDDTTLVVASSDLSHYLPEPRARELDTTCIQAICQLHCEWMAEQEACGKGPILALMHLAKTKNWRARLLDYRTSGDTAGDRSAVVGYAAIAFFEGEAGQGPGEAGSEPWAPEDGPRLLALARQALVAAVRSGQLPEVDLTKYPARLVSPRACFVTLTEKGQLRGCIGHIFPREPLVKAVVHNAAAAALRDPRFKPVTPEELDAIRIELSILTLPQPLRHQSPEDLLAKLRPGIDGVVLRVGNRQATYLPQVWEQLPDKEAFLSHLAEKADLAPADWKNPQAVVLTYQVQKFEEPEPEPKPKPKQ